MALLTGFRVVANVDAQRLDRVVYAPEAGVAETGMAALAALVLAARRARSRRRIDTPALSE